jgi:hypothetical protein
MPDNDQKQENESDFHSVKKAYSPPVLTEYGNMAELTQGTGLLLLDILVRGSLTVTATVGASG